MRPAVRRGVAVSGAAVLLAGAVVVAREGMPRAEVNRATSPARTTTPTVGSSTATLTTPPSAPAEPSAPGEDAAGPGTTEPGVSLRVAVRSDGSFEVAEQAIFTRERTTLALAPPDVAGACSGLDGVIPAVRELQAIADGRPVDVPARLRRTVVVDLGAPTRVVELRYVLDGTTRRSLPSDVGRGLGVVAPISTVAMDADVILRTADPAVLNLICPRLSPLARVCASGESGAFELRDPIPSGNAVVVLQISMPRP